MKWKMLHRLNGAGNGQEKKMQKKIRRVQHWCNFKVYLKYAWYEFRTAIKGR